jgi:Ca2+-binding RTX toxin-like protein
VESAVWGNAGTNTVAYWDSPVGVRVDLAEGVSTGDGRDDLAGISHVSGSEHGDVLLGDARLNVINGMSGDDRVLGRAGNDGLLGGRGDDHLNGGQGNDTLLGGPGHDTCRNGEYVDECEN